MKLLLLLLFVPFILCAQEPNVGINFEKKDLVGSRLSRRQKRKTNIFFLDCYTTWCAPCKAMEKDVYSDKSVGDFFNNNFLSFKIQMDRTDKDNDTIKGQYIDASYIGKEYKVVSYPSYLFFNPDGKLIHRSAAYQSISKFMATADSALIPGKVYEDPFAKFYQLLKNYKSGDKDYREMPYMIAKGKEALEYEEG